MLLPIHHCAMRAAAIIFLLVISAAHAQPAQDLPSDAEQTVNARPDVASDDVAPAAGIGPSQPTEVLPYRWIDTPGGGATIGVFGGLVAIVVGALFNAWLMRRRDNWLRENETRALAAELAGEFEAAARMARVVHDILASLGDQKGSISRSEVEELPRPEFVILSANYGRLGVLGVQLSVTVTRSARVMDGYWQAVLLECRSPERAKSLASEYKVWHGRLAACSRELLQRSGESEIGLDWVQAEPQEPDSDGGAEMPDSTASTHSEASENESRPVAGTNKTDNGSSQ